VNRAAHFFTAQSGDHTLDLPPMAKARDVALVAAALGSCRGLKSRIVTIALHEIGRVGQREASVDEGRVHARPISPSPVSRLPTNVVNEPLTMMRRGCGLERERLP
jgi:hypothetical protein